MSSYYEEIVSEIQNALREGDHGTARALLYRELNMPYIPREYEKIFLKLQKDLRYLDADARDGMTESDEHLLDLLGKNEQLQMDAAAKLSDRNLRNFLPQIRSYLSGDPFPEAAALLIEALGRQEIREEFTLQRDGMIYEFFGDSITPPCESGGFLEALRILAEKLENDYPDVLHLCRTLLIHDVYMFLPLSYDTEEGEDLARSVIQRVSGMMDDGELYKKLYE